MISIDNNERLKAIYNIVLSCFPNYKFNSIYRYRVIEKNSGDNRYKLQAVKKAPGLPDILPISMHPGVAGCLADLKLGCIVLVSFIEGDPSLPVITHYSTDSDPGFLPLTLSIDAVTQVQIGTNATSIKLGDTDQQKIARYPAIKTFCDNVILYLGAVHTSLTSAGFPPAIPVPSQLTTAASSSKVTTQ